MKKSFIILSILIMSYMSFAGDLAFAGGNVHLGVGFNGWHGGAHQFNYYVPTDTYSNEVHTEVIYPLGPGVLVGVDVGAVDGMFSFGGDMTLFYNENITDFYYPDGVWSDGHKLSMWGISTLFRFGFHPFGLPSLKGKVPVASQLDPYVGFRMGVSIMTLDMQGVLHTSQGYDYNDSETDADFIFTPTIGVRWYPHGGNVGLWGETDLTNFLIAVTFNLNSK